MNTSKYCFDKNFTFITTATLLINAILIVILQVRSAQALSVEGIKDSYPVNLPEGLDPRKTLLSLASRRSSFKIINNATIVTFSVLYSTMRCNLPFLCFCLIYLTLVAAANSTLEFFLFSHPSTILFIMSVGIIVLQILQLLAAVLSVKKIHIALIRREYTEATSYINKMYHIAYDFLMASTIILVHDHLISIISMVDALTLEPDFYIIILSNIGLAAIVWCTMMVEPKKVKKRPIALFMFALQTVKIITVVVVLGDPRYFIGGTPYISLLDVKIPGITDVQYRAIVAAS